MPGIILNVLCCFGRPGDRQKIQMWQLHLRSIRLDSVLNKRSGPVTVMAFDMHTRDI